MYSQPPLPPENILPQQECDVADASSLQLSWCREALGQMVPHACDELVALPCAHQLPPVAAVAAPTFPSSLCRAIYTSAGSESRRAGVGVSGSEDSGRLLASPPSASQVGQVIIASVVLCSRQTDREPSTNIRCEGKLFPHCVCLPRTEKGIFDPCLKSAVGFCVLLW